MIPNATAPAATTGHVQRLAQPPLPTHDAPSAAGLLPRFVISPPRRGLLTSPDHGREVLSGQARQSRHLLLESKPLSLWPSSSSSSPCSVKKGYRCLHTYRHYASRDDVKELQTAGLTANSADRRPAQPGDRRKGLLCCEQHNTNGPHRRPLNGKTGRRGWRWRWLCSGSQRRRARRSRSRPPPSLVAVREWVPGTVQYRYW